MLAICPDCGFPLDRLNESQPVCPRCGADPEGAGQADVSVDVLLEMVGSRTTEANPETTDHEDFESAFEQAPEDPDLDLLLEDAEAIADSVANAPVFVSGTSRIH